jgi:hypothetical protein
VLGADAVELRSSPAAFSVALAFGATPALDFDGVDG